MYTFRFACMLSVVWVMVLLGCISTKFYPKVKAQDCINCQAGCGNLEISATTNDPCWPNLWTLSANFDWTCTGNGASIGCRWSVYWKLERKNSYTYCNWELFQDDWVNNGGGDTFEAGCPTQGTQTINFGEFDLDPSYDWQLTVLVYPDSITNAQNCGETCACKGATYTISHFACP